MGDGDSACVRGKMRDWRKAKKAGEASFDRGGLGQFWLALKKRTQFMEECDGDSACVRGKMRDWRKAKKAGEASLDRYDVEKECNYDMACIRRVWEHLSLSGLGLARLDRRPWSWARRPWRKARKSGETSLDRGAPAAQ